MADATEQIRAVRAARSPRSTLLLALSYAGFVSLGLPDAVAGVAWPSVREAFHLSQGDFGQVFIGLSVGCCVSSFCGGRLTLALGVGTLLAASSGLVAAAMLGYALAPIWPVFVALSVVWGLGSGAIDAGLNAFVASRFSARHVNWLHACYSLGATLGPLLMTAMLVWAGSWRLGYGLVGGVLLLMTAGFALTRLQWGEPARPTHESPAGDCMWAALGEPLVWLQVAVFFLYTGLELTVGQWCYTLLTESRGVGADAAGALVACYFGSIGVGRVVFGLIADRVGLDRLVRWSTLAAAAGTAMFAFGSPVEIGLVGLALVGLGLAPVYPCLMARTPQRLETALAAHAVGFQVSAAMLGAAVLPGLAGLWGQHAGLESIARFALLLAGLLWGTHELLLGRGRASARCRGPSSG
jgi:fucose permease